MSTICKKLMLGLLAGAVLLVFSSSASACRKCGGDWDDYYDDCRKRMKRHYRGGCAGYGATYHFSSAYRGYGGCHGGYSAGYGGGCYGGYSAGYGGGCYGGYSAGYGGAAYGAAYRPTTYGYGSSYYGSPGYGSYGYDSYYRYPTTGYDDDSYYGYGGAGWNGW